MTPSRVLSSLIGFSALALSSCVGGDSVTLRPEGTAAVSAQYFNNRKLSIFGGSNEIQKNIIAKVKLGGRT